MADGTQADENPALSQSLHMVLIHHMTSIWLVEMINWDSDHRRNDKLGKPLGCNIHVVLIQSDQIFVCGIESKAESVVRAITENLVKVAKNTTHRHTAGLPLSSDKTGTKAFDQEEEGHHHHPFAHDFERS